MKTTAQSKPRKPGVSAMRGAAVSFAMSGHGARRQRVAGERRLERGRHRQHLGVAAARPTICSPKGMPASSSPTGSEIAGWPTVVTA